MENLGYFEQNKNMDTLRILTLEMVLGPLKSFWVLSSNHRWFFGVCSTTVFSQFLSDPHYEQLSWFMMYNFSFI